jgi:hypothetical protein
MQLCCVRHVIGFANERLIVESDCVDDQLFAFITAN